ncbi:hypothetical protein [Burkholderia ubonensis]|uniref:hypothetical protein n=1 Tax=Burkholderia ubonensis TaxID=101571 RepID=UPI000B0360F8|nr:hypothetical protein [Burkholderia ubonensis]
MGVSSVGAATTHRAQSSDHTVESRHLRHPVETQGQAYDRVRGDLREELRAKLDQHYEDTSFSKWQLENLTHVMAVLGQQEKQLHDGRSPAYDACLKRLEGFLEKVPPYSSERSGFMKPLEDLATFVVREVGDPRQLVASYQDGEASGARERMNPSVRRAVDKRIDAVIAIGKLVRLGSSKLDTLSSALHMCATPTDTFGKLAEKRSSDARINVLSDVRSDRSRRAERMPDSASGRRVAFSLDDSVLQEPYADLKSRSFDNAEQGGQHAVSKRIRRRSI